MLKSWKFALGLVVGLFILVGPIMPVAQGGDARSAQEWKSLNGENCDAVVSELAKNYFSVTDISKTTALNYSEHGQKLRLRSYRSLTPGSMNQEYLATFHLSYDPRVYPYRKNDKHQLNVIMTGEYWCDSLRVKSYKVIDRGRDFGGVERGD